MRLDCPVCGRADAIELELELTDTGEPGWWGTVYIGAEFVSQRCECELSAEQREALKAEAIEINADVD